MLVPRFRPQVIQHLLSSLWKSGLVARSLDAQLWLIKGWSHQKIDKPRAGKWNPSEIEWVSWSDSPNDREAKPKARRKDRIGEDRRGSDRIVPSRCDAPATVPVEPTTQAPGSLTWKAYKAAYQKRYGVAPSWNAKTANNLRQFVGRIPAEDAPQVAEFYLTHNDAFYVKSMHPVGLLLKDAEKLRTEWVTGHRVLGSQAREVERMQHNVDSFAQAAERIRARNEPSRG